ncbi:hypothetical protein KP78_05720 [Jeotgalibacillus soli]|uniref:Uncharacterized protein n=1 Tax=Jeotgalibacillus soli TaxID=889306 RepID=A0A0C2VTE7_9BACL|nr:hypothetical protein KP78_05720 [Jeotgalibacillus soli]
MAYDLEGAACWSWTTGKAEALYFGGEEHLQDLLVSLQTVTESTKDFCTQT